MSPLTRRSLLAGLTAAIACDDRPSEPRSNGWTPPGNLDPVAFPFGVQAGDATATSITLSVRTAEPTVQLVLVADLNGNHVPAALGEATSSAAGVRQTLVGLRQDTVHRYVWRTPDGRRSPVGRFRTPPVSSGGTRSTVRIGATSCLGATNKAFPTLAVAARAELDAFVMLGDAIYTRTDSLRGYRKEYDTLFATASMQELTASTSLIPIWDDHEVANDWVVDAASTSRAAISDEQRLIARQAFDEAFPTSVPPGSPLWRTLRWGDIVEFIVLDARDERKLSVPQIVSAAQLDFAINALKTSTATFKVVVSGVHVADHALRLGPWDIEERWQWYVEQRAALVAAMTDVSGVIVLTGDMHYGGVHRLAPAGEPGDTIWEVAAGPSGSVPWEITGWFADNGGVPAQYATLIDTWNVAVLTFDPAAGEASVDFLDDVGDSLGSQRLL